MLIDSVRYLNIENTANRPKANPMDTSAECNNEVTKKTPMPNSMNEDALARC